MTKIIADRIVAKTAREEAEKRAKESKGKAGQASGRKLSKKERMKQELSGHLGQMFGELKDSSAADAQKDEDRGSVKPHGSARVLPFLHRVSASIELNSSILHSFSILLP